MVDDRTDSQETAPAPDAEPQAALPPGPWWRRALAASGRGLSRSLAVLRHPVQSLGVIGLFLVLISVASSLFSNAIVIEAPQVPKALQDKGITPELLVHKLQARVQEIRHIAASNKKFQAPTPAQQLPSIETAGIHLSLNTVALAVERLLGLEGRRRLAMSFVCQTKECLSGDVTLHVIAFGREVVSTEDIGIKVTLGNSSPEAGAGVEEPPGEPPDERNDVVDVAADIGAKLLLEAFEPYILGVYHLREERFQEALRISTQMLDFHKDEIIWSYNLRGIVELENGHLFIAQKHFQEALDINPKFSNALANVGILYSQIGNLDKSKQYLRQALAIDEKNSLLQSNLGKVLFRKCEWLDAVEVLERGMLIDPSDGFGYWALAALRVLRSEGASGVGKLDQLSRGRNVDKAVSTGVVAYYSAVASHCFNFFSSKLWVSALLPDNPIWLRSANHP